MKTRIALEKLPDLLSNRSHSEISEDMARSSPQNSNTKSAEAAMSAMAVLESSEISDGNEYEYESETPSS